MASRTEVAGRRAQALTLRTAGASYKVIADQLGYKTPGAAAQDVTRALAARQAEMNGPPDQFTALELERLDAAERRVQSVIASAAQVRDHPTVLFGVDRLVRLSETRRRLVRERVRPAPQEASPVDELRARRAERAAARASAATSAVAASK